MAENSVNSRIRNDRIQPLVLTHRTQTIPNRTPDVERFELFPGSQVYATPWDADAPEGPWSETTRGPIVPSKDDDGSDDEGPLLEKGVDLRSPRRYSFDSKKVRFSSYESNLSGATAAESALDEFGSVPTSANTQAGFFQRPPIRPVLKRSTGNSIWIPAAHPFWPKNFEPIYWPPLIAHGVITILAYPILIITAMVAEGRPLFVARSIVGAVSGTLGFLIGLKLMDVGKRLLEACTWATIIHLSMFEGRSGITLEDLKTKSTYPNFTWLGTNLLLQRTLNRATRRSHRPYDKTWWSFHIIFFILISVTSACLSFVLGRLVDLKTRTVLQDGFYKEVQIMGDLTADDISNAEIQLRAIQNIRQTWTLSPYGAGTQTARPVKLNWQNQNIYFAELSSALLKGERGYGTFKLGNAADESQSSHPALDDRFSRPVADGAIPVGSTVRMSRWGLRMKCEMVPNPLINLIPKSPFNFTYSYVPNSLISNVLTSMDLDVSFNWNKTLSRFLHPNDTLPENINLDDIGFVADYWDNGVAHSFKSAPIYKGENGLGWVELDVVMVRLNTTYTPTGQYGLYLDWPDGTSIGYDAALCIQAVEPWVVDAYNSTNGVSTTFNIVGKGDIPSLSHDYGQRIGDELHLSEGLGTTVDKWTAYGTAFSNSRSTLLKDNGRDFWWTPSPTIISWTGNTAPDAYGSLSMEHLEDSLGMADAANLLPYLTGSQLITAYQYPDKTVAIARVLTFPTILTLFVILVLGFSAAFLVPRLPLGIPRRDFGVFTWLAAFEGDEVIHPAVKQGIDRNMDLEELQRRFGKQKIRLGI